MIKIILEENAEPLIREENGVTVAVAFQDVRSGIIVEIPMSPVAQAGLVAALEGRPYIHVPEVGEGFPPGVNGNGGSH